MLKQACYAGEPGGEKKDRAANIINVGNGAVQVYLSSNAVPDPKSDDTILIGPPFFLELKLGGFKLPIQVGWLPVWQVLSAGSWVGRLMLSPTRLVPCTPAWQDCC